MTEQENKQTSEWGWITVDASWLRSHKTQESYTLRLDNFSARLNGAILVDGYEMYLRANQLRADKFTQNKVGVHLPIDYITLKRYPIDKETGLRDYGEKPEVMNVHFDNLKALCVHQNNILAKRKRESKGEEKTSSKNEIAEREINSAKALAKIQQLRQSDEKQRGFECQR